jgi:hypothetical protein
MRLGLTLNQSQDRALPERTVQEPTMSYPPIERRHKKVLRVVWACLFGGHADTVGLMLIRGQCVLALTVLILNARIMATPPPLFQDNVLLLPAWLWSLLILASTGWQIYAKAQNQLLWSGVAAFFSAGICGGLLGPFYLRALSFFLPMLFFWVAQAAQTAILIRDWRKQQKERLNEQAGTGS